MKYERFARTATHLFASILFFVSSASAITSKMPESAHASALQSADNPPIFIKFTPERVPAGQSFRVEVHVGTEQTPVDSLFGISFALRYNAPAILEPDTASFSSGTLLGKDVVFFKLAEEDLDTGTISIAVTRKAGSSGVSGFGTVFEGSLKTATNLSDSTVIQLSLERINGRDKDGAPIPLQLLDVPQIPVYPPQDFELSLAPDAQTVEIGRAVAYEISLTPKGGFNKNVPLTFEPSYPGIRATFNPDSVSPGQNSMLTLSTDSSVIPGSYPFHVIAQIDTLLQTVAGTLSVYSVPISPASTQNEYLTNSVFQIDVQIGATGRPVAKLRRVAFKLHYSQNQYVSAIVSDTLQPQTGDFLGASAAITTHHSQSEGSLSFELESSQGGGVSGIGTIVHIPFTSILETPNNSILSFSLDSIVAVDVDGDPIYLEEQDYSVNLAEKVSYTLQATKDTFDVSAGDTREYEVTLVGSQSYAGKARLTLLNAPPVSQWQFSPPEIGNNETAILTIQTDTTTANGIYSMTIRGVDGNLSAETMIALKVTPAPVFSIVVIPPEGSLFPGDTALYRIRIDQTDFLSEPVRLNLSGQTYPWLTFDLNPTVIDAFSEANLTFITTENAPFGTFAFQVIGKSGTSTRDAIIELTLEEPPPSVRPIPFTPNNDGFNDVVIFEFDELQLQPGEILIFDLHGRKVAELHDKMQWDGKDENGNVAQPGAYLYVVRVGDKILKKGVLALAR